MNSHIRENDHQQLDLPAEIAKAQLEDRRNSENVVALIPSELGRREELLTTTFAGHQGNIFSKLQDLYGFMDEINSFVARFTPCKKGCSHCCLMPVSVSTLEIEYIKKRARKFRSKTAVSPVAGNNSPCPFLIKGSCSIYEVRPFVCRRHLTLTADSFWCHPDRCNSINLSRLRFSEVDKVYEQILFASGPLSTRMDIRDI